MTTGRDTLSKSETIIIAAIEDGVPPLIEARAVVAAFHVMIRTKAERNSTPGSNKPDPVSSHLSPTALPRTKPLFAPQSLPPGPMIRQKGRSQNSSS
jgi:hypothetical protein